MNEVNYAPHHAGHFIDEETGEIIETTSSEPEIDRHELMLWVLRRMQRINSMIEMEKRSKAEIMANCDAMIQTRQNQLDRLHSYYDQLISEVVWDKLPRNRNGEITKKSLATPYGKIQFKTSPEKISLTDQDKALAFTREYFPDAVIEKVSHSVSIMALRSLGDEAYNEIQSAGEESGFVIIPKQETMTISFGKGADESNGGH